MASHQQLRLKDMVYHGAIFWWGLASVQLAL